MYAKSMHDSQLSRPVPKIPLPTTIRVKKTSQLKCWLISELHFQRAPCCSGYLICGRGDECIPNRGAFHQALCGAQQSHVKPSQCEFDMSGHEQRHPSDSGLKSRRLNAGQSSASHQIGLLTNFLSFPVMLYPRIISKYTLYCTVTIFIYIMHLIIHIIEGLA